jgi:hypothetical protein
VRGQLTVWDVASGPAITAFDVPVDDETIRQFAGPDDVWSPSGPRSCAAGHGSTEGLVTAPADGTLRPLAVRPGHRGDPGPVGGTADGHVVTGGRQRADRIGPRQRRAADRRRLVAGQSHLAVLDAPPSARDQLQVFDLATATLVGAAVPLANVSPNLLAFPTPDRIVLPRRPGRRLRPPGGRGRRRPDRRCADQRGAGGGRAAVIAQGDVSDVALAPDDTVAATGVSVQKQTEAWDDTIEATQLASKASLFTLGGQSEDVTRCSSYEGGHASCWRRCSTAPAGSGRSRRASVAGGPVRTCPLPAA